MKKFAISSRPNEEYLNQTRMSPPPGSPPAPVQGVNIILGGAMLSGIILAIFILCYCCHKTNRKSSPSLSSMIWRDPGLSLQIYTVEAAQNRLVEMEDYAEGETPRCPTPGPPPYDSVVMSDKTRTTTKSSDSTGLPSYEAALRSLDVPSPTHQFNLHQYA
ncbi:uncharacterized protein LOC126743172 [Anthonomus grandis grandis]|uniref:uncharacterized protein LOC126743172 n=1 Tax=Anthonomus grandis grandis TaxID=2921223 RepID=UPI00216621D8|nr:uncharacterized protein LOC126743172 [Anthonomus grandis grandis]XP_050306111.1 uncharacterized protein LOC126743172 [Anthonomus grandis grandis]